MPLRTVLLAAALILMPLGARGADLVIWWEQGYYPEEHQAFEEIVTAFEQMTGKDVELVRHPGAELPEKAQAALDAGQPPDLLFGLQVDAKISQWAYEDRLVDLTEAIGPLASLFDPDALEVATLLNGRTGRRVLYTLPVSRSTNHVHVWTSLLEQAGFTLADIPKQWEAFWAFWCDQVQPAVRRATGREDIWGVGLPMSAAAGDTYVQFTQFQHAYDAYWARTDGRIRVDDPAARASFVKTLDSYTALYRKGCTPPDAVSWTNIDNNERFLDQTVVMTPNESLSIPSALRASRPDDYYQHTATIEWPNDASGRPLIIYADVFRAAVLEGGRNTTLAKKFVRFLVEDGWLAHWLTFAGDRWLPPMRKLVEQPFWLDPSDPHRMASAIQALTRSQSYDVGLMNDRVFADQIWQKAVYRVVAEGISPDQAVDEAIGRIKQLLSE